MARTPLRQSRQMPRIYGNLQPKRRSFGSYFKYVPLLLWCAAFAGLGYVALFSGFFSVKTVQVEGTRFSDQRLARQDIRLGTPIWFISKKQAVAHILEDPVVEGAVVMKGIPDRVRVVVTEKEPALLWVSGSQSAVLGTDGIPFRVYSSLPDPKTVEGHALNGISTVTDTKALPVQMGKPVAGSTFVTFINEVRTQLETFLPEMAADHFEVGDTTYDTTMISRGGAHVQFNTLADAGVQVRNLTRLVHQKKVKVTSSVDLRIDRWAYVQ